MAGSLSIKLPVRPKVRLLSSPQLVPRVTIPSRWSGIFQGARAFGARRLPCAWRWRSWLRRPCLPKTQAELFAEAQSWEDQGQWSLAMSVYHKILKDDPANVNALYRVSLLELKVGATDAAVKSLKEAVRLDPSHEDARAALEGVFIAKAVEASGKGRPDDALKALEEGVAANPKSATAHLELARELKRQGQADRAIEEYRRAVDADAKGGTAPFELGQLYAGAGRQEEAAAQLAEAVKREPRNAAALNALGLTNAALGKREAAIASLDEAMKEYMRRGQEDKAIAAMNAADKLRAAKP
jgi:tetratricopeptide (TPR) repeat protein